MGFYNDNTPMVPKYLFIVLNQPSSKKILKRPPPDRKILDPYPSADMVPPVKGSPTSHQVYRSHLSPPILGHF